MENRRAPRASGVLNLPRVGGVAGDNDNDNEKIYYGFGVFMGLPLAGLKAMKDDFLEQQALTGGPPRRALPSSVIIDNRTHRVEDEDSGHDEQRDAHMAPPPAHQQQQRYNGYERQDQEREGIEEERSQGLPSDEHGGEDDDANANSDDGSDDFGNKSHSLNFILH